MSSNYPCFCCDLLKIHYLCGDKDNTLSSGLSPTIVVICSKFITFAVTKTTSRQRRALLRGLWFAQNSLPLRWQRQLDADFLSVYVSCDLLKIHYLCGDKDNTGGAGPGYYLVVICSKFITFAVTKTTIWGVRRAPRLLWFAQNSLPLRWQRQPANPVYPWMSVVICSKFITFAVTKTTKAYH